jgi:DNA sulfur modification protein DndD
MIIDEIILHNFGIYKERQKVQLTPPRREKPVVLIGGQNGGGKTTLLDALQLVLYGRSALCSNRGNLNYEEFLRRCINHDVSPKDGAAIEVKFRYFSKGIEHIYQVHRSWAQNGKEICEHVGVFKDGKHDAILTEGWNEYVERYIPSRIFNLFFFDGEKIGELADLEKASQLLSIAVHSLLGLDVVEQLSNDLITLERRKRVSIKNNSEREIIDKAKNELEELEKLRSNLFQEKAAAKNILDQKQKNLEDILERFRKEGGELFEKRDLIESQKLSTIRSLQEIESELREIASGPTPFLLVIDLLASIERQDGLEQTAFQAKALNDVLEKRDGQLLEIVERFDAPKEVLDKVEEFFSQDRYQRIQQAEIESYLSLDKDARKNLKALRDNILPAYCSKAIQLITKTEKLKSLRNDIERKLASIPDQDLVISLMSERRKAEINVKEAQLRIKLLDEELGRFDHEIKQKEYRLISLIEKAVESDFACEDITRVVYHSQHVRETLKEFHKVLINSHINKIGNLILNSFKQLISKKTLVKELSIDPKSFFIELRGWNDEVISMDRLSQGERQIFAVSILWGLARASGRPLPVAIDTPLGRLDSSHRNRLIEGYFPYASHQVLLFSTDEEISKKYLEKLKPYIGLKYYLDFDDSTRATTIRTGYFW